MFTILLIVQILVSISIVTLVLLQQGKGADMGAGFGSGASGTVFGARGSGSFLTRATAVLATVFFVNCLLIASPLIRHVNRSNDSVIEQIEQQNAQPKAAPPAGTAARRAEEPGLGSARGGPRIATRRATGPCTGNGGLRRREYGDAKTGCRESRGD